MATELIDQSFSVTNKEALKDKIHEIHDFCRNNGVGYGMNALKVFMTLFGLKKIEEHGQIDKINLKRPECEFSYLLKLANDNDDGGEKLHELVVGPVLDEISECKLKKLLFCEIPKHIYPSVLVHLIKAIDEISCIEKTCHVLLSGKIYEYFIGRDASAISKLGAYYTNRKITDYIYKKLNPSINEDGTIRSMCDPFAGSGGLLQDILHT